VFVERVGDEVLDGVDAAVGGLPAVCSSGRSRQSAAIYAVFVAVQIVALDVSDHLRNDP
jgi:hypothetical protein